MKIWEAVQMLQQMDQTKEVTVTFGTQQVKKPHGSPTRDYVIGKEDWAVQDIKWPKPVYFNPDVSHPKWAQ